jgi:hypothetical protein
MGPSAASFEHAFCLTLRQPIRLAMQPDTLHAFSAALIALHLPSDAIFKTWDHHEETDQ